MFDVISFKNLMLHLIRNRVVPTTLASVFQNTATITDNVDKLKLFAFSEWSLHSVPVPQQWEMWLKQIRYMYMVYGFMNLNDVGIVCAKYFDFYFVYSDTLL